MAHLGGPIYQAKVMLNEQIPLHVYMVKGAEYAVWIDSGIKSMFGQLVETMQEAGVQDRDLHFILHTHSHHDHIGCNAQLKDRTGCLIAAPAYYAAWHADFERHYQEFARPFPDLIPDTPALRDEVLSILDEPRPLDLFTVEGVTFNLGGGVSLTGYSFPGHMMAELGWFEASTHTLILGDAITGLDWSLFHSHLTVQGYRDTLVKIGRLVDDLQVEQVLFAHFPPMTPDEVAKLLVYAASYINEIESTLIRILASQPTVTLEKLWSDLCARMERLQEFRALNMVFAHMIDLQVRGLVREEESGVYSLR
jgi:glyoxylase-like metal-dependent hydrolase (beta-lactamase superfamily II)